MAAIPTGEDLCNWLVDGGILEELPVDYHQYELAMSGAVRILETDTGHNPFVATPNVVTIDVFKPRGSLVDLRTAYQSIEGVYLGPSNIGTELPYSTGYLPIPFNAGYVTQIDLAYAPCDFITVEGVKGRVAQCPDDVYLALMAKAAMLVTLNNGKLNGQIGELRQGEVGIKYFASSNQHAIWDDLYKSVMKRYRKVRVY
ncbi:MAG: hypothetical protein EOP06_00490 [Proteobacteria bacterium]|nr:MAG: hypothetical protein EOP06_00490 [Pseudomonadota bacterium]